MDLNDWKDEEENDALIERYEITKYNGELVYFEMEDFEYIVNHYLSYFEFDKAKNAIMDAECYHSDPIKIALLKARVSFSQEAYSEIINILHPFTPSDLPSEAHILCARSYAMLDEHKLAFLEYQRALEKEPEAGHYFALSLSDSFLDAGEIRVALRILLDSINKLVPDLEILQQIAYCYDLLGDSGMAKEYYNKCIDINPFNKDIWFSLGLVEEQYGMYDDAVTAYNFALTIDDKLEKAYYAKASLLARMDRFEDAIEIYKELIEFGESPSFVKYQLAELYGQCCKFDEAMTCYCDLINMNPEHSAAYMGMGVILLKQGDFENSILSIDKALELEPENTSFLFNRGKILLQLGATDEASTTFYKIIALDPIDVETWILLSYLEPEKIDEGIEQLGYALSAYPEDATFPAALSVLYFRKNDIPNCLSQMTTAFQIRSDAEIIYQHISPDLVVSEEFLSFLHQFTI